MTALMCVVCGFATVGFVFLWLALRDTDRDRLLVLPVDSPERRILETELS
ncbi:MULTISPECIES: hypothetical protein [Nocardiaceae]|nr:MULTISPECIES: hypothetical protein [Rhodococcus]